LIYLKMSDDTNKLILRGSGELTKHGNFALSYSPEQIHRTLPSVRNITDVFVLDKSINPALSLIRKDYGDDYIEAYIESWILNLNEYLNIKRTMSARQMHDVAVLLLEDYYMLTVADLKIIFTRVKKGYYGEGKLYESIDGVKIISWFSEYFEERIGEAESTNIMSSRQYTKPEVEELSDKSKDIIADIKDRLAGKVTAKIDEGASKLSKAEKTAIDWVTEIYYAVTHGKDKRIRGIVSATGASQELATMALVYFRKWDNKSWSLHIACDTKNPEYQELYKIAEKEFKNLKT